MFVCAACGQTLELPRSTQQGNTLRIRGSGSAIFARMNDRNIRLFPQPDGGSFGLMPIPTREGHGKHVREGRH